MLNDCGEMDGAHGRDGREATRQPRAIGLDERVWVYGPISVAYIVKTDGSDSVIA